MKSTKVPTKSWHGFSVETVNEDISSRDNFPPGEKTRLQASAQRTSLTARRRERPSGHTEGPPQHGMGRQPAQKCLADDILGQEANKEASCGSKVWRHSPSTSTVRGRNCKGKCQVQGSGLTLTAQSSRLGTGAPRRGSTQTGQTIRPVTGASRQGPTRCPPRAGTASLSRPSTKTSQAGMIFPCQQGCKHWHG
jgi:hypothetical protein